jgi:CheY-like chemotaxis protein
VLIVEDDNDVREALVEVLTFEGYRVATATNGLDAIEQLRRDGPPDLILLDLMMPVMDGRQFRAAQVKEAAFADVPVIVISADGQVDQKIAGLGISAYLRKPIEVEDLLDLISRHC